MSIHEAFPPADRTGPRVPLSVLELATVSTGSTGAAAVRDAVDLARRVDELGYARIWFAEHHLSPGVASASPAVLAAAVAARTERIRVGSGAVLLSTTSPLVAAEQFGTIAALHPGRVDLGIGRAFTPPPERKPADQGALPDGAAPPGDQASPGAVPTDGAVPPSGTPASSGGSPAASATVGERPRIGARVVDGLYVPAAPPTGRNDSVLRERLLAQKRIVGAARTPSAFRDELELVLGLRDGTYVDQGVAYTSPPVEGSDLALWVLASSGGERARVAGELGLPIAANFHVSPATTLDTIAAYRASFRPGVLRRPYVVVSADVLVAETVERARALATPFADWVLSIRRGVDGAIAYPEPETSVPWEERPEDERALVADRVDTRIVGDAPTVVARLETLQRVTGADELLLTTETHDPADAVRSFELLAERWGTPAVPSATRAAPRDLASATS